MSVRWVSNECQICHSSNSVHKTHALYNVIMTGLNGDCVVMVTITVTTDSYTREALCFSQCQMGVE